MLVKFFVEGVFGFWKHPGWFSFGLVLFLSKVVRGNTCLTWECVGPDTKAWNQKKRKHQPTTPYTTTAVVSYQQVFVGG